MNGREARINGPNGHPAPPAPRCPCVPHRIPIRLGPARVLVGAEPVRTDPSLAPSHRRPWPTPLRIAVVLAALAAGYVARDVQQNWRPRFLTQVAPLEHFLWWHSFSEVEQTRAQLHALCLKSIAESRAALFRIQHGADPLFTSHQAALDRGRADAIRRLRLLIPQFEGTDQAVVLRAELLRLFHLTGAGSDWLDTYLDIAYLAPAHEVLDERAQVAAEYARSLGREAELRDAIEHRGRIPARFWRRNALSGAEDLPQPADSGLP